MHATTARIKNGRKINCPYDMLVPLLLVLVPLLLVLVPVLVLVLVLALLVLMYTPNPINDATNMVKTAIMVPRWPSMNAVKSNDERYSNNPRTANATNAIMTAIGRCMNC